MSKADQSSLIKSWSSLLGGIVNILNQSEAFDDVVERTKALEHENVSNKACIEALENWVLRQNQAQ